MKFVKKLLLLITLCSFLYCTRKISPPIINPYRESNFASTGKIESNDAKIFIQNYYDNVKNNSCKTLSVFFSLEKIGEIADYILGSRDTTGTGLRFYFGKDPSNGINTILLVITKKNEAGEFQDIFTNGVLKIASAPNCPEDCRGALLLEDRTSGLGCNTVFKKIKPPLLSDERWGNIGKDSAASLITTYANKIEVKEKCPTLSVHFDGVTFAKFYAILSVLSGIGTPMTMSKDLKDQISGIRVYFGRYPIGWGEIESRDKNSIIFTITQALEDPGSPGNIIQQDILTGGKVISLVTPMNNGSRCPPGSSTLIAELLKEGKLKEFKNCSAEINTILNPSK